jgi:hypothetical protein
MTTGGVGELTPRWYSLNPHEAQDRLWTSDARFRVVPAGRRSGKTELAKRFVILAAMEYVDSPDGWFVCAAPTHDQAKRIYWDDLKKLAPKWSVANVAEGALTITFLNGAKITVLGLDKPERIEGRPLDGIVLDEYGNMKSTVWTENVRPALSTPGRAPGWAWFVGVPEGRNHYYRLAKKAEDDGAEDWSLFHWTSAGIVSDEEIESAKSDLDPLTFEQEYNASFINFTGRAYYTFDSSIHSVERLTYDPALPLYACFDFNVSPGIAAIAQESMYTGALEAVDKELPISKFIGEVWIPRNSNTPLVCRRLLSTKFDCLDGSRAVLEDHPGDLICYGDATGGARGTAKVAGSDWDLIREELKPVFGSRLKIRVPKANPPERMRVNSVNARFLSQTGISRALVDPRCRRIVEDLDGTTVVEGGSGELDKKADPDRTHITDGIGYYVAKRHPIRGAGSIFEQTTL